MAKDKAARDYICFDLESAEPVVSFTDPQSGRMFKIRPTKVAYNKAAYFTTLKEMLE